MLLDARDIPEPGLLGRPGCRLDHRPPMKRRSTTSALARPPPGTQTAQAMCVFSHTLARGTRVSFLDPKTNAPWPPARTWHALCITAPTPCPAELCPMLSWLFASRAPAPPEITVQRTTPSIGDVLGDRYRLDQLVGRGGGGLVFQGRDLELETVVAIKILSGRPQPLTDVTTPPGPADLRREAVAAMRLSHPHITRVFAWESFHGVETLIMEFVDGPTPQGLAATLPSRRLPTELAAGFAIDALEALAYAHGEGLLHNDVKPRNLLVAPGDQLKLCDFGIASSLRGDATLTSDSVAGTLAFISPERLQRREPDGRSDLYSLAASVYHLCHGAPPFGSGGATAIHGHLHQPPPPSPHLPELLQDILFHAMEKDPDRRFSSAMVMREALLRAGYASRRQAALAGAAPRPMSTAPSVGADALPSLQVLTLTTAFEVAPPRRPPPADMVEITARSTLWRDRPLHTEGFLLDRTPVTNAAWATFVQATGEFAPAWWFGNQPPPEKQDHPVVCVRLEAARRFAAWSGKRLPTASEWVLAATTADGRPYAADGPCEPTRCQCPLAGDPATASVDAHPGSASPDGALDMLGNVWEWTEDADDLAASTSDRALVFGASFRHPCRAAMGELPHSEVGVHAEYAYLGFRCARDILPCPTPLEEPGSRPCRAAPTVTTPSTASWPAWRTCAASSPTETASSPTSAATSSWTPTRSAPPPRSCSLPHVGPASRPSRRWSSW